MAVKKIRFLMLMAAALCCALTAGAQNFKATQRSQEKTIKAAHKCGKVTQREYEKLIEEQELIKAAIEKYEADRILTPHEKNVIHDKLVRAEKRLRRYKTNGEIY
jgi:septal ring factor EnvC (AmiA/AmiB activator)